MIGRPALLRGQGTRGAGDGPPAGSRPVSAPERARSGPFSAAAESGGRGRGCQAVLGRSGRFVGRGRGGLSLGDLLSREPRPDPVLERLPAGRSGAEVGRQLTVIVGRRREVFLRRRGLGALDPLIQLLRQPAVLRDPVGVLIGADERGLLERGRCAAVAGHPFLMGADWPSEAGLALLRQSLAFLISQGYCAAPPIEPLAYLIDGSFSLGALYIARTDDKLTARVEIEHALLALLSGLRIKS